MQDRTIMESEVKGETKASDSGENKEKEKASTVLLETSSRPLNVSTLNVKIGIPEFQYGNNEVRTTKKPPIDSFF